MRQIGELERRMVKNFESTGTTGMAVVKSVKVIISQRENAWVQWKEDLCKSYERPAQQVREGDRS